jgi:hypothetical protein
MDGKSNAECLSCNTTNSVQTSRHYFAHTNLKDQFKHFFESSEMLYDDVSHQFETYEFNGKYQDVCDGTAFRKLREKCDSPFITLSLSSDGFQVQKTNNGSSVWPFMYIINELPRVIRFRNVFLSGVWLGNGSLPATNICELVVDELNELSNKGFTFEHRGLTKTVKVHTICGIFDSPARCKFLGMSQYNGYYGYVLFVISLILLTLFILLFIMSLVI